mmetsp:Transcript_83620/g.270255  ORF Transcript_83620/g.270255 Transcript_83620/m.270255 type:complete len:94 (+) Transcript_83620:220-501(+)
MKSSLALHAIRCCKQLHAHATVLLQMLLLASFSAAPIASSVVTKSLGISTFASDVASIQDGPQHLQMRRCTLLAQRCMARLVAARQPCVWQCS